MLMYRDCKKCKSTDHKRIFLFTNDDNPKLGADSEEAQEEKSRVKQVPATECDPA
jgi:hypothetical protein